MTYSKAQYEMAKTFGTATLHEAAGRIGALPAAIKPLDPSWLLAGPAFPVECQAGDNLWIHRALYRVAPGDILVVSPLNGIEWGYWGDILNTAAIARKLGGLVINGGVRDTARLIAMPLVIFSAGIAIRGTGKDEAGHFRIGEPISLGDVEISPGDLIVGDRDGLVALPASRVDDILACAAVREADEAEKIQKIANGQRTIDLYEWGAGQG